jgi:hypothetical protein
MEKYLKAVSEMYSQFKQREPHQMEKYVGRFVSRNGEKLEVVGYRKCTDDLSLIVDGTESEGWYPELLDTLDVIFKDCEMYWYADISDLID